VSLELFFPGTPHLDLEVDPRATRIVSSWSSKDPKLGPKVTSVQFAELNGAVGYTWGAATRAPHVFFGNMLSKKTWGAPAVAHPDIADNHTDAQAAYFRLGVGSCRNFKLCRRDSEMGLLGLSYVNCL
jgi:hypothetical protein